VSLLTTDATCTRAGILEEHILTENSEMGFMGGEREHDEISILQGRSVVTKNPMVKARTYQTVNNVLSVGVVTAVCALTTYEIHDLMLSLTRDAGVGKVNLHLSGKSFR
jgi:hypothetical protein